MLVMVAPKSSGVGLLGGVNNTLVGVASGNSESVFSNIELMLGPSAKSMESRGTEVKLHHW